MATKQYSLQTNRFAVLSLFALNGWLYSTWAARVPNIQDHYAIADSTMGLVLIAASLGAFGSMPFAAYITNRLSVVRVCLITSIIYITAVVLIPQFTFTPILFGLYAFMGVGFGLLDVGMNSQAVEVERAYGRSLMSSFHAAFSAAMIGGAVVSSAVIKLEVSFAWHLGLAAIVAVGFLMYAYPRLYPQSPSEEELQAADEQAFRLPVRATWLIGFIGFCCMMSEASISDWTTKYMLEVAGSEAFLAPWSLAAFSITMTVGRIFGDRLRNALGDAPILRGGSILAFIGMGMTLLFPNPAVTILGSAAIGTGLSIAVPIIFSLSGKVPGLSASAALSMVTTISYLGLFLGPAVIGFLTEAFGLRIGYLFILFALLLLMVLTWRTRVD